MTQLIAEVGLAHEGSLGTAISYIDLAKELGIDYIKFQMHVPSEESTEFEKFRINFSKQDQTRYDYWKRTSFTEDEWLILRNYARDVNIKFLVSPFSLYAIDFLIQELNLDTIKIGSAEFVDPIFFNYALSKNVNIIASLGFAEPETTSFLEKYSQYSNKLSFLECVSNYPSNLSSFNINRFRQLSNNKFGFKFGISDHSATTSMAFFAISNHVNYFEAHIVYDKRQFGPDSSSSLSPKQWAQIVTYKKDFASIYEESRESVNEQISLTFSRSLAYKTDLKNGSLLELSDLTCLKAGNNGISSHDFERVVGKTLNINVNKNQLVKTSDFL